MSPIVTQMISQKINTLTAMDLYEQSKAYHLNITKDQSEQIVNILQVQPIDITDKEQCRKVLNQIFQITGPQTAKKIHDLWRLP